MTIGLPLDRHWVLHRADGSIAQALTLQRELEPSPIEGLTRLELDEPAPGIDGYVVVNRQIVPRLPE